MALSSNDIEKISQRVADILQERGAFMPSMNIDEERFLLEVKASANPLLLLKDWNRRQGKKEKK